MVWGSWLRTQWSVCCLFGLDGIRLTSSSVNFFLYSQYNSIASLRPERRFTSHYCGGFDATTPRSAMLSPFFSEGTAFT